MTPERYLERTRALLPALRARITYAEQLRRMPDETFKDFQEAGLFRALQPRRYDGYELDPGTFFQAVMEIGAVCGSSAWVLAIVGVHNWHLGLFDLQAQEDVWRQDTSVQMSTSLSPTGTVTRVTGGFRLQGRWSFSSGCDVCQWVVLGGLVPPVQEGTEPEMRAFLVPRSDYVIDDNWHVVGLCSTGSKDIVVHEAVVPAYRTISYLDMFHLRCPGLAVNTSPLFRLPFGIVFPYALTAPPIGVALGAVQHFREQTQTRLSARDGTRAVDNPFLQVSLAEAVAEVDAARDRLHHNFAEMMALAQAGQAIPLTSRARYRWDAAKATDWSLHAVDRVFAASGGRALFLNNPLQRAWRDVHAMRAHAANNLEQAALIFGRSALDLPPANFRF